MNYNIKYLCFVINGVSHSILVLFFCFMFFLLFKGFYYKFNYSYSLPCLFKHNFLENYNYYYIFLFSTKLEFFNSEALKHLKKTIIY